jgi:hypothetical protein
MALHECQCPRCHAELEFDLPDGLKAVLGKPRVKPVPALIHSETAHVAENLRMLADDIEQGKYSFDNAPVDQAAVLFLCTQKNRVHVAPVRISNNWLFDAVEFVYRQMLQNGFKSRFLHGAVRAGC